MSQESDLPSNFIPPVEIIDVSQYPQGTDPYETAQVKVVTDESTETPQPEYSKDPETPYINNQQIPTGISQMEYSLYAEFVYPTDPVNWTTITNDPAKYVGFWNTPDALRNFQETSRQINQLNNPYWAIPFLVNLFILFIINCCCWKKQFIPNLSRFIFFAFLAVFCTIGYLIGEQFLPKLSVKFGLIVTVVVHFIFYCIRASVNWPWFFCWLFVSFIGYVFYVITHGRYEFDASMVSLINKNVILKLVFIIISCLAILFLSIITVFTLYSSAGLWTASYGILQFYLVVSFYNIVCVFGHCFYMVTAYLSAKLYLTGVSPSEKDVFQAFKRGFYQNFGVACKLSYILPITEFVHAVARFDPVPMTADYSDRTKSIANFYQDVARFFIKIAKSIAKPVMKKFGNPSRRALVYSACYGIEYNEACRRYSEVCCSRGANLLDEAYKYDTQLIFKQFNYALALLFLTEPLISTNTVSGLIMGRSFFLMFALYFMLRTVMRSFIETVFVFFGELPENADNIREKLYDELCDMFRNCVRTRKTERETDTVLLSNYQQTYNVEAPQQDPVSLTKE